MKTKTFFLIVTTLLFVVFNGLIIAQTNTLTILYVNDTHSNLAPLGPRNPDLTGTQGGISRAASIIGFTRMTEPNVLLLHAGDAFIGDFFFNVYFGAAEFQLMNALGFDAMAVGNHEFDLQPSTLNASLQASFPPNSGFPLLSANLILDDPLVEPLKDYIKPYTVKQVGDIKVGIFGLLTPETNFLSLPYPAVVSENFIQIAAEMVGILTSQGCDVILCLSHLGYQYDQLVASYVPGINAIIEGHDHYLFETPVEVIDPLGGKTLIVQAGSFYKYMGKLKLICSNGNVDLLDYQLIPLNNSVPEEPSVATEVNNLIAGIEAIYGPVYSQQIGYATSFFEEIAVSLNENGNKDTPIGNLVTDAFLNALETDIAIEPGGSTAQPLYEGPLVGADAFRVVGYGFNTVNGLGFRVVTFNILGSELLNGLEFGLSDLETSDEFFIQVSGMSYIYNPDSTIRLRSVKIGNEYLDPNTTYSVATNELVLQLLADFVGISVTDPIIYDFTEFEILANYISSIGNITPVVEGRIVADKTYTTPQEKVQMLISAVDLLIANGILNQGNGNSLKVKLNGALAKINQGQIQAAINKLNAFINEVDAFIRSKKLTQTQGQNLIDLADALIEQISGDNPPLLTELSKKYFLSQNFPNPFNPATNIRFEIPRQSFVKLIVYNILGREVATLVNEKLNAGSYEFEWNASEYPSGVYFYKLITDAFVETKKMVLLK